MDIAKGRTAETSLRFRVGVDDVVPKLILARLLEPAFNLPQAVRLVCVEGTQAQLLPQLAVSELDVIISDAPADPAIKVRAFSHLLGQTGVTLCAAKALARRLRAGFPQSLDGAPALLPTPNSSLRRALDEWFDSVGVRPQVVAEFEDLALLNACGHRGAGFFPAPDVVAHEITAGTGIRALGRIDKDHESLYAISVERRIKHPAALALLASAKNALSPAARRGKAARARGGRRG
jgi:LysR family transcriptional activator of nhaA